ncbi:uncharacterized protein LOC112576236 [Pomacea canaliculata]|uniref:uncharacterized protein LOC112576236 n=1 Tax=Pomacea canaliculata TaxID=400727 RepID=UPI000D728E16|nr:uncharacterized protein LOC112576236 [Pomacea canaliculata]
MIARAMLVCAFVALFGLLQAHPERPPLTDPGQARVLFKEVVQSEGSTGNLTVTNLIHIFKLFDTDGDNQVARAEFVAKWQALKLGDAMSAIFLFQHADTDGDGILSMDPDLPRVFKFFDLNGDGVVSEPEFVVAWSSLSS